MDKNTRLRVLMIGCCLFLVNGKSKALDVTNIKDELPRLKVPIAFCVDDGTPFKNSLYQYRVQIDRLVPPNLWKSWESPRNGDMVEEIPTSFYKSLGEWIQSNGVRGKFSVEPIPGAAGSIDNSYPWLTSAARGDGLVHTVAHSAAELQEFIEIIKNYYVPNFIITPEMITHTKNWDTVNQKLGATREINYLSALSISGKADYIGTAMQILKNAGIICEGLTTPNNPTGVGWGEATVGGLQKITPEAKFGTAFMNVELSSLVKSANMPRIIYQDESKGEMCVEVIGNFGYVWDLVKGTWSPKSGWDAWADSFIDDTGTAGRAVSLYNAGSYLVFFMHIQELYANGATENGVALGFKVFQETVKRINTYLNVFWMDFDQLGRYYGAAQTYQVQKTTQPHGVDLVFSSKFTPCDGFTVSFDLLDPPANFYLYDDLVPLTKISADDPAFGPGKWYVKDNKVYLCFNLEDTSTITLSTRADLTPPAISESLPAGTGVALNTKITVTFSEVMNETLVENAFSVSPVVSGSFAWSGNQLSFTPEANLSKLAAYTVKIATAAADLGGNNLSAPHSWSFTTGVLTSPLPGDKDENEVLFYPNPYVKGKSNTGKITFHSLPKEATIRIYRMTGELVQELSVDAEGKTEWDVREVSSGIYLCVATSAEGVKKGKVSVIK